MFNKQVLSRITSALNSAKAPAKKKDIIVDPRGQWDHPGQPTRIPANEITMRGVPYPVMAYPDNGQPQLMYPDQEYSFPGAKYVDEYPQMNRMRNGGTLPQAQKGITQNKYNKEIQEARQEQLYNPVIDKLLDSDLVLNNWEKYPSFNTDWLEYMNTSVDKTRNIPPQTATLKELQQKISALPSKELNRLMYVNWQNAGIIGALKNKPSNVSTSDMYRYAKHLKYLKSQGYTLKQGGTNKVVNAYSKHFQPGGFQDDLDKNRKVFEDWTYGKDLGMTYLPKAQVGQATQADSLSLYNNAIQLKGFYDKLKPYYEKPEISDYFYPSNTDLKKVQAQTLAHTDVSKANKDIIKSNRNPNAIYMSDIITGAIDPKAPLLKYDTRIKPQGMIEYIPKNYLFSSQVSPDIVKLQNLAGSTNNYGTKFSRLVFDYEYEKTAAAKEKYKKQLIAFLSTPSLKLKDPIKATNEWLYRSKKSHEVDKKLPGFFTTLPYYDPIAIKPAHLLTDAELKLRVKKYGTVGIPASRLTALKISQSTVKPNVTKPNAVKINNVLPVEEKLELKTKPLQFIDTNRDIQDIVPNADYLKQYLQTRSANAIVPPASTVKWVQHPQTGTWYQIERPQDSRLTPEYNIRTGTYKKQ